MARPAGPPVQPPGMVLVFIVCSFLGWGDVAHCGCSRCFARHSSWASYSCASCASREAPSWESPALAGKSRVSGNAKTGVAGGVSPRTTPVRFPQEIVAGEGAVSAFSRRLILGRGGCDVRTVCPAGRYASRHGLPGLPSRLPLVCTFHRLRPQPVAVCFPEPGSPALLKRLARNLVEVSGAWDKGSASAFSIEPGLRFPANQRCERYGSCTAVRLSAHSEAYSVCPSRPASHHWLRGGPGSQTGNKNGHCPGEWCSPGNARLVSNIQPQVHAPARGALVIHAAAIALAVILSAR